MNELTYGLSTGDKFGDLACHVTYVVKVMLSVIGTH